MRKRRWQATDSAAFVIASLLGQFLCDSVRAQDADVSTHRWAIIAGDANARSLADLLTAELSDSEGIELVERDQIRHVLAELELNASGLAQRDRAMRFGQLSQADALLIIDANIASESRGRGLRLRLIDTRTSVRLLDTIVPRSNLDADVAALRQELLTRGAALSVPSEQLRLISIAPIISGEPGYFLRPYCKTLTALVTSEFNRRPEIIVLEREDLQRLTAERDLSGIELDLRAATRLLEASIRRTDDNQGMLATCRITTPGKGNTQSTRIGIASREPAQVRKKIVSEVLDLLGQKASDYKPSSLEQEAQEFDRRCRRLVAAYRFAEAAEMAEAAYALAPTKKRLDAAILEWNTAVLGLRKKDRLAALLGGRRHNELILESVSKFGKYHPHGFPSRNPTTKKRFAPPRKWIQYQSSLAAETDEEIEILTDVNSLRRQILEVEFRQAAGNPLLRVHTLLRRIDLELYEVEHDTNPVRTVTGLLRELFALTEVAQIDRDFGDEYYAAMLQRLAETTDKVHQAKAPSAWRLESEERWAKQLLALDQPLGKAAYLLALLRRTDERGEQAAANLLGHLQGIPLVAFDTIPIDKVYRLPALLRVSAKTVGEYVRELVARGEEKNNPAELLHHSESAFAMFRELPRAEAEQLARRVLALLPTVEGRVSRNMSRLRRRMRGYAPSKATPEVEFSLNGAPGPWQAYIARPVRLELGDHAQLWDVDVDHRADASQRGGALLLARGLPYRKLSIERVTLAGGEPTKVGPEVKDLPHLIREFPVAVSPDTVFVATREPGFTMLTADRAELFTEADGAASNDIFSMAWWKDRLFIGYRDAFGSFDPATKQFELLASSTSIEARNPIDSVGSFIILRIVPDEKNDCLWMSLQDHTRGRERRGLWKFEPDKNAYTRIFVRSDVEISHGDGGFLLHKSTEPRIHWLNHDSATITPLQQFSHTPRSVWVGRPIPQLIKIGDHLIRGDGLLLTGDGRSFQIPGEHRWDLLERVGDGFITHYDKQTQTIWYITPKQE